MLKLTKKKTVISLIILVVLGSFINFFFTNMLMSGISNKDSPYFLLKLSAGFPGLFFNCSVIAAILFVLRLYLHPTHEKKMLLVYGIVISSFGVLGLASTIFSGVALYGSFVKPYPFPGFHIVMTLWYLIQIGGGILAIIVLRPKVVEDDVILHKLGFKRVMLSIGEVLIIYFAMNRFGAFLWSPTYIQLRNLGDTLPFYLSLLLPIGILVHDFLYIMNKYKTKIGASIGIAISSGLVLLSIVFFVQIILRGQEDPSFISSISPAVPIERLMTFPIDILLSLLVVSFLGIFTFTNSIKFRRLKDKESK